jgi:hypothetical protein
METPSYRCFLVRCRRDEGEAPGDPPTWRFTVQEAAASNVARGFACLDDVESYLETQLGERGRADR